MLFRPAAIWRMRERWKSNDGTEPSDFYVATTRIGGGLCLLGGLAGIIASLL